MFNSWEQPWDETEERYEQWDGEKLMMKPSSSEHECILSNLTYILNAFIRKHKLGKTFLSNTAVFLHGDFNRSDFRMPDLSFVAADRLGIVHTRGIYGAPDLVVEILSKGRAGTERDRVEKYALYEQYGVREYWIVQPFEESIEIYLLEDGKYVRSVQSRVLSGIELDYDEVFDLA